MATQFVSYAEVGKRAMRPENPLKITSALGASADYILTGDIIDKDHLLLSEKMRKLMPSQLRIIENIIDECICLLCDKGGCLFSCFAHAGQTAAISQQPGRFSMRFPVTQMETANQEAKPSDFFISV